MTRADTLIVVTTCRREPYLRRCLPRLASAIASDSRFALAVSLDGPDPETRTFCAQWDVPLVYSHHSEGVGIAKNRAFLSYPDFEYYFFLEDDVEVCDGTVFPTYIAVANELGLGHMSLFERGGSRGIVGHTNVLGHSVCHSLYGGGVFNFFTAAGLRQVGGWHPIFAEFRRWGHTEHSYRFVHAGLAAAPFSVITSLQRSCIWHSPPSVTRVHGIYVDDNQIAAPERELMNACLTAAPVSAPGDYYVTGPAPSALKQLARLVSASRLYPLLHGRELWHARSDYLVWRSQGTSQPISRASALLCALAAWPSGSAVRRELKAWLVP